jgi:hypothetical protein
VLLSALVGGCVMPAIMNAAAELVSSETRFEPFSLKRCAQLAGRALVHGRPVLR